MEIALYAFAAMIGGSTGQLAWYWNRRRLSRTQTERTGLKLVLNQGTWATITRLRAIEMAHLRFPQALLDAGLTIGLTCVAPNGNREGQSPQVSDRAHLTYMAWNQEDARHTRLTDHKQRARAKRQAQLEVMHAQLVTEVERLVTGDDWLRALEFATRFRSRSFHNVLLIHQAHADHYTQGLVPAPTPTYVAGFRQWQTLGRSVMKGQPGTQIMAPVKVRVASMTPNNPNSWRRLAGGERAKPGETTRSKMVGLRPAYVWDISQTKGDPIPEKPRPKFLKGDAPDGLWEALAEHITERGFDLRLVSNAKAIGGCNGITDFMTRSVSVRVDMDDAAMVRTLAHEAGHVVLHSPVDMQEDAARHRGIREVEAEGVSMMITAAHGMDSSQYTVPYVSRWASQVPGKDPVQVVQDTGTRVRVAAISILNYLDTEKIPDGTPRLDHNHPARETSGGVDRSHRAPGANSVERPGL